MKIFEFHKGGSVSILDGDYIYVTLSADEVAELVADYHKFQGWPHTLRQIAIGAAGGVLGASITLTIFYWLGFNQCLP